MQLSSTRSSDIDLTELARMGDRPAFAQLLRRHDERMRGLAYRLLADHQAVEDTLHDAYLAAHRTLDRIRPTGDVGTWLYRLTYNACVDRLRLREASSGARPEPESASMRSAPESASAPERVRGVLADLPVGQRVAVVLVDGEGFDHRQAAEILGVAPGTVASRLRRARAALRGILEAEVG